MTSSVAWLAVDDKVVSGGCGNSAKGKLASDSGESGKVESGASDKGADCCVC